MAEGRFSALLSVIVPPVIALVVARDGLSEKDAIDAFYRSQIYAKLADEKTKFWHYSAETLYAMFCDERAGRAISYPEEAF